MIVLQENKEVDKVDIYKQRLDEVEMDGSKRGLTQNTVANENNKQRNVHERVQQVRQKNFCNIVRTERE